MVADIRVSNRTAALQVTPWQPFAFKLIGGVGILTAAIVVMSHHARLWRTVATAVRAARTEEVRPCPAIPARVITKQGTPARAKPGLHVIQLIERLLVISVMRCDPNIRVAWDKAIYKIGRNRA